MGDIECQYMRYAVDMADSSQTGVMDLLSEDPKPMHDCLPCREDVGRVCEQRERSLESCRLLLSFRGRRSQAVQTRRAGRNAAELNQHLWRNVEHFSTPMQRKHRTDCDAMLSVRRVRKASQDARVDQVRHYS